jgi:hypothetical protein
MLRLQGEERLNDVGKGEKEEKVLASQDDKHLGCQLDDLA